MTSTMTLADNYATLTADVTATTAARAALEQRIKELERDAKRYRFAREAGVVRIGIDIDFMGAWPEYSHEALDAELDRAMSEAALDKMSKSSQELQSL